MLLLKQSTAVIVTVGPFVDASDGVTMETGITLGAADSARLIVGGTAVDISGNTWSAVTGADGYYYLTLTSGNTSSTGQFTISIADASVCLPVFMTGMVIESNWHDSMVPGSVALSVNVVGHSTAGKADINAEVVDALSTDTYAEPSTVPGATISLAQKIGYLFMDWRNKKVVDASANEIRNYADDGTTVVWERDFTDSASILTVDEAETPD